MKKLYLLPNIITAFGLSCGLFAIFKICTTQNVDFYTLSVVAGILLVAALADVFDGAVARIMHAESDFGGIFDSLSDAITFGVGPSIIVLKTLGVMPQTEMSFVLTLAAMVYSVCGVLRLARFNVMQNVSSTLGIQDKGSKNFTGLPIPAAAAAAVSSNLLLASSEVKAFFDWSVDTKAWVMVGVLVILGYFMISRWKFPSIKSLHIRVASFQLVFMTVLSAVFVFYGILHHFAVVFFVVSWTYIVTAWVLSIIRMMSGKNSPTLVDFEPEPEELDVE